LKNGLFQKHGVFLDWTPVGVYPVAKRGRRDEFKVRFLFVIPAPIFIGINSSRNPVALKMKSDVHAIMTLLVVVTNCLSLIESALVELEGGNLRFEISIWQIGDSIIYLFQLPNSECGFRNESIQNAY
jgi:hypothetical protein